jgi:diketogulonate reductase-like aldo/keto reductase
MIKELIGFGTGRIPRNNIKKVLKIALDNNYTLIDTGDAYDNEDLVGECVNSHKNKDNIKILTKYFGGKNFGIKDDIINCFKQSCKKLKKKILDIYLIHMPGPCEFKKGTGWVFINDNYDYNYQHRINCWKELLLLKNKNLVKYIGVSNWTYEQLLEIENLGLPDIIEIEWCPCYKDMKLYEYCNKKNILIVGYGNVKRLINFSKYKGSSEDFKLNEKLLLNLEEKYQKTRIEIILTWCRQLNIITIPSSINEEHIIKNIHNYEKNIFKLEENDMELLNNFKQVIKGHSLENIIN